MACSVYWSCWSAVVRNYSVWGLIVIVCSFKRQNLHVSCFLCCLQCRDLIDVVTVLVDKTVNIVPICGWSFSYCCGLVQQCHVNFYQRSIGTRICNGFARLHKKSAIMVYCVLLLARLTSTLWARTSYSHTAFVPQNWNFLLLRCHID